MKQRAFATIGFTLAGLLAGFAPRLCAQDFSGIIKGGAKVKIAVPDLRGSGDAQRLMSTFNQTLWGDLVNAGLFDMVAKTFYPHPIPQQPSDFGPNTMTDWSNPPAQASYLAFGYGATQTGTFVIRGWLFDLSRGTPGQAQALAKNYFGSVDDAGARKTAHEFAADIIGLFGGKSLFGTHIYYVHQASNGAPKEIWVMDWDGGNQHAITHYNGLTIQPSISADGSKLAFTSYAKRTPGIVVFSVDPLRDLHFYNQIASVNSSPTFTPDGKQVMYSSSAGGRCCRLFLANLDGTNFHPVTHSSFIDTEPRINPKTGSMVAFVSGRSGPQQIYKMNIDGGDIERLTDGTGEASNPSWHPDGEILAFAWTRGFAAGKFNIFVMDVASRSYKQLTHDEGRNENPSWAPDGAHLTFASTRGGRSQIYSMLANGTESQRLTSEGINFSPVWGK
jgi:TolB protein